MADGYDGANRTGEQRRIRRPAGEGPAEGQPGENEDKWRRAGVKSFVFMGCDVVSTLQTAHDILGL